MTWTRIAGFDECRECYSKREAVWDKEKIDIGGNAMKINEVENMTKEKYEQKGDVLVVDSIGENDIEIYREAERLGCSLIQERKTGKTVSLNSTKQKILE